MMDNEQLPKGYKNTEVGVIPEDWEVKRLGEIATIIGGGTPSTNETLFWNGNINWFTPTEIGLKKYSDESVRKITKIGLENSSARLLPVGTILLTTRAGIGDISILMSEACTNQGFQSFVVNDGFDNEYIYYLISTLKNTFIQNASGSTFLEISPKKIKAIQIAIPTKSEQTAIATALSDADALINSLEKLIAKKRNIKQGAMQQLLKPKEGWEVKKLGEVIYLQGGYAFKSELFTNVGVPIIRISDVGNNKVETDNSVCYEPFNIPKEFVAKKGDVLIAMSGATTGKIGVYNYDGIAYINQRVGKFVVLNQNETSQEFISHIVRSEKFKENLTKEIAQGAQPNISGKQIQSIVLPIPNEKEEQDRIATILSDMDAEIAALETKLEKYKKVKLGMMQNLLTGKIRLI